MLDNLVESKNNSRAARKLYGALVSTFLVVSMILSSATVWSLFAKELVMSDDMELSNLVSPIPVAEPKPQPEPEKPRQQNNTQPVKSELPNRQNVIARIDEPQIAPTTVSVAPNTGKARPKSPFTLNPNAAESDGTVSAEVGREIKTSNNEIGFGTGEIKSTAAKNEKTKLGTPPPVLKKEDIKPKVSRTVTGGVINGKASFLPKPLYPAPAKAVGASGAVNIQVTIDEQGNVISAKAVSGHPLLRQAAEDAARKAKFTPTKLSDVPVKVSGLIVYNFAK